MREIQVGMERLVQFYKARGYHDSNIQANTQLDDANHTIKLIMQVTEGPSHQDSRNDYSPISISDVMSPARNSVLFRLSDLKHSFFAAKTVLT